MGIFKKLLTLKNVFCAAGIILILSGSAFLGVCGGMIASSLYFHKNGVPTEAVIEEIRDGDVQIRYSAENHEFTGPLGYYNSSMQKGDTVPIYYDQGNPGQIYAEDSKVLCHIFLSVSLLMMLCGSGMVICSFRRERLEQWLLRNGTPVQAEVIGTELDRRVSFNSMHPHRLVCQCRMPDGSIQKLLSGHIWYNPEGCLLSDSVTVYLDPRDGRRYYVDLATVLPDEEDTGTGDSL